MKKFSKILSLIMVASVLLTSVTVGASEKFYEKPISVYGTGNETKYIYEGTIGIETRNSSTHKCTITASVVDPVDTVAIKDTDKNVVYTIARTNMADTLDPPQIRLTAFSRVEEIYDLYEMRYDFMLKDISYDSTNVTSNDDKAKRAVLDTFIMPTSGVFEQANSSVVYYETATQGETDLVFTDDTSCAQNKWYTVIIEVANDDGSFDLYVKEKDAADNTARYLFSSKISELTEQFHPFILGVGMFSGNNTALANSKIYLDNITMNRYHEGETGAFTVDTSADFDGFTVTGTQATDLTTLGVKNFPENRRPSLETLHADARYIFSAEPGASGEEDDKALGITFDSYASGQFTAGIDTTVVNSISTGKIGFKMKFEEMFSKVEGLTEKYKKFALEFDLMPVTSERAGTEINGTTLNDKNRYDTNARISVSPYFTIATDGEKTKDTEGYSISILGRGAKIGNTQSEYKLDQWNKVKLLIDTEKSVASLYVNDAFYESSKLSNSAATAGLLNLTSLHMSVDGYYHDILKFDNFKISSADSAFRGIVAKKTYAAFDATSFEFKAENGFDLTGGTDAGITVTDKSGNTVSGTVVVTNAADNLSSTITFTPSAPLEKYGEYKLNIPATAKIYGANAETYEVGKAYSVNFFANDENGAWVGNLKLEGGEGTSPLTASVDIRYVKVGETNYNNQTYGSLFAAAYNGSRLESIDRVEIIPIRSQFVTMTATINKTSETTAVKCFAWNNSYAPFVKLIEK